MGLKTDLEHIKTVEECTCYLQSFLKKYSALYNKVYSDYDNKNWTKQIKAYEYNGQYVVTIANFSNMKITDLSVCLTNHKPKMPHPVFPIMSSFAPNSVVYTFKN